MSRFGYTIAILVCLTLPMAGRTDIDTERTLYQLMSERMSLMPEVAKYKLLHDLPIEDLAREATVLERTVTRIQTLNPTYTKLFFSLQMNAAKELQDQVSGSPTKQALVTSEVRSLNEDLRPKLTALGDQIIEQLRLAYDLELTPNRTLFDKQFARFKLAPQLTDGLFNSLQLVLTKPPESRRDTLARIQSGKTLRVGVTLDYAPFSYQSKTGEFVGIDIELAKALAADFGYDIAWVKTSWPTLMADAQNDRFDIALSGISITAARQNHMIFSVPYHTGGKTAIGRCEPKAKLTSLAMIDRSEVRVIVNPGGTNEAFIRQILSKASITIHPDNRTIFQELLNEASDVMFTDSIEAHLQAKKHPSLCVLLDQPLTFQQKGILLQPDPELKKLIDDWLLEYIASKDLKSLFERHSVVPN